MWSYELLAKDAGAFLVHPFLDPGFAAALARAGGRTGLGDRTAVTRTLFGDLLPNAVVSRSGKALFDEVLWSQRSRRFAEGWHGTGVDQELVDQTALRSEWLSPEPHSATSMLLQHAWLASAGDRVEHPADGGQE
jgi:hypothetical protein